MTFAHVLLLLPIALTGARQSEEGAEEARPRQSLLIVVGAGGEEEFTEQFAAWADRLQTVASKNSVDCVRIGDADDADQSDLRQLQEALAAQTPEHPEPLWIIMIGHGTFDGRQAKFNLRGPDLAAKQLNEWLKPFQRTVVIVNCASASSPFLNDLAGANRVVITATKSGYQYNFSRLGEYFTKAIGDADADLDKDGQTSLLEAYLLASSGVAEFYRQDARLATEEALLDDNGDGRGTPSTWFRGVRVTKRAQGDAEIDGMKAHQLHLVRSMTEDKMPPEMRTRRNELEQQIETLRTRKAELESADYYQELLPIMLDLARLYESVDSEEQ